MTMAEIADDLSVFAPPAVTTRKDRLGVMARATRVTCGIRTPCFTRTLREPDTRTLWIGSRSLVDSTSDECDDSCAAWRNVVVSPRRTFVAFGLVLVSERD